MSPTRFQIRDAAPGRNDPCPCGSGRKYKVCCWRTKDSPAAKHALAVEAKRLELARLDLEFQQYCRERGLDPEREYRRRVERHRRKGQLTMATLFGTVAATTPSRRTR